jgi:hypothetical protein
MHRGLDGNNMPLRAMAVHQYARYLGERPDSPRMSAIEASDGLALTGANRTPYSSKLRHSRRGWRPVQRLS